jgi:hypothetical protein
MNFALPKVGLPSFGQSKRRSKKTPPPTWREMLLLKPIRNPGLEWVEEEERVVLTIHHETQTGWKARVIGLFVAMPKDRRVVLDAIGSDVWRLTDGENTLGSIAKKLAKKYKLSPREAELSLQQFFKELGKRGYIGFITEKSEVKSRKAE